MVPQSGRTGIRPSSTGCDGFHALGGSRRGGGPRGRTSWYRRAGEQGNARGQYNLGVNHSNGRGVTRDDRAAVSWYRRAAEQGNALGQRSLGWMYENGRGVRPDRVEAVRWYRRAADQGDWWAQDQLDGHRIGANTESLVQGRRRGLGDGVEHPVVRGDLG